MMTVGITGYRYKCHGYEGQRDILAKELASEVESFRQNSVEVRVKWADYYAESGDHQNTWELKRRAEIRQFYTEQLHAELCRGLL